LSMDIKARATACALAGGLMLGSGIGLVLGGAYWMGANAQAEAAHARALRMADAAAQGFSVRSLKAETDAMGPGAMALAQRQDLFQTTGLRGRQGAQAFVGTGARATAPSSKNSVVSASADHSRGPAAQPFHFADGGALQSTRDLDCLTDAVYYEARGESAAGQAAVAQVVLNRVRHPAFPKSVCGVVFQRAGGSGCQFSFVCDGSMRRQREPGAWRQAEDIAARALDGAVMATIGNATHFHTTGVSPGWGPQLLRVAQVGLHVFYRLGGHAGGPDSFSAAPQHSAPGAGEDPNAVAADGGAPAGQLILASATLSAPKSAPTQPPAPSSAAPPAPPKASPPPADKPTAAPKTAGSDPVSTAHPAAVS
jgi:spore germination cell wall hydrolase CwlJ-like protein